jgi:hypothetical protein
MRKVKKKRQSIFADIFKDYGHFVADILLFSMRKCKCRKSPTFLEMMEACRMCLCLSLEWGLFPIFEVATP